MDQLHRKIASKSSWYDNWHKQPSAQIFHWFAFGLVVVLVGIVLLNTINPFLEGLRSKAAESLVVFPNANVEFLIGPQVKSGTSTAPGAAWFDQNAIDTGLKLCAAFPDEAHTPGNTLAAGTITLTKGSNIVTGIGTHFLTDLPLGLVRIYDNKTPDNKDDDVKVYSRNNNALLVSNGTYRQPLYIPGTEVPTGVPGSNVPPGPDPVSSDTQLTLSAPWSYPSVSNVPYAVINGDEDSLYQGYKNYYDFGLVSYINYYRTGDQRFLDCAHKVTDSWWSSYTIDYGRNMLSQSGESYAPRVASITSMVIRALEDKPEWWPWITDYVRVQQRNWVDVPLGWWNQLTDGQIAGTELRCINSTEPNCVGGQMVKLPAGFYYGVRDGGYSLLYAANLAKVHPDQAVRDEFRQKVLDAVHGYYARGQRLQYQNSPLNGGFYFYLDPDMQGLTTQAFQEGLLAEGLIQVHRLTGDDVTKNTIVKLAQHLYQSAYNPNGYRAMYYFLGGSFTKDGYDCSPGCGGADSRNPWPPTDGNTVTESRQLNPTALHTFGYAYSLTGDPKFKTWGDDVFDATFSGTDGYRGIVGTRGKEYDEGYRSSGRYLAWRLGSGVTPVSSGDTAAPTASITAPAAGATVSGTISVSANASDNIGITGVQFKVDSSFIGGQDITSPYSVSLDTTTLSNGSHTLTAIARDAAFNSGTSSPVTITVSNAGSTTPPSTGGGTGSGPYGGTAAAIPGTIQAENFDLGGQNVGYNDSSSVNIGGQYRSNEGVDIAAESSGYVVGWTQAGEWLKYTVNVTTAGTYNIDTLVSGNELGAIFHVEVDGTNVTGPISIPDYNFSYRTLSTPNIQLSTGQHVLKVSFDAEAANGYVGTFDSFKFNLVSASPTPTPTPTVSNSHLSVSPSSVSFSAVSGDAAPAPKSVTFSNTGSASSSWAASSTQSWCHLTPSSGTLASGGQASLSVSVDDPSNVGTFPCSIAISDANADNSPQSISVSYTVTAAPIPNATPAITSFSVSSKSAGSATITWTTDQATTGTVKYGTVKTSLNLSAADTVSKTTHSVTLTGLSAKSTYYYQITATNSNGTTTTLISSFRTKPR